MKTTIGSRIFRGAATVGRCIPHFRGKYRILNSLYSSLAQNNGGVLVAPLSKPIPFQMSLNLDCAHERLAYCVNGYESDTVLFLFKLWDSSGYFMDIGANIGLISVPFTMLAKTKLQDSERSLPLTVSFEPVASNFASLRSNVELNGLTPNVKLFNAGAGAENKSVIIQVEGDVPTGAGTGTANILPDGSTFPCERQSIDVVKIDSIVAENQIPENCSLIKIDTDGYDFFALLGATELLRRSRPIVFGEFSAHCMQWHGHTMDLVKKFAEDLNYVVLVRQSKGTDWNFRCADRFNGFIQDAMLVPEEKLASCGWCIASES
jgi:FkbM family methyltransferase